MNAVSLSSTRAPLKLMLAISLAQGVALYLLALARTHDVWPSGQPVWELPLWTLAVAWPVLLLLAMESAHLRRAVAGASVFASVLALVALYTGWQLSPEGEFPSESIIAVFAITTAVASFKALMYLQPLAARRPVSYATLFANSWRNFLTAGLSAVMAGATYLVLTLWAALLNVIGIDFFLEIFREMWFAFPAIAVAFGLGVYIFRGLSRLIDGLTGLLEGLMRLLLPLLVAMLAVFLAALPFTGLEPLWDVGSGTALLMALNGLALFFLNAVYQTGRDEPYPAIVHRLVYGGAVLLPIVSGLALYGLSLRIAQYGWTVERCWALAVCVGLALFSCGYAGSILRLRDAWPRNLAFVNRSMGLAILALMLLVNSPLLDFRQISLASQQQRVDSGEIELSDFDFWYAREFLGRPAWLWMQGLIEQYEGADPALAALIANPRPPWRQAAGGDSSAIWERMVYRPAPFDVPDGVRAEIDTLVESIPVLSGRAGTRADPALLVEVDLNGDAVMEYVFVAETFLARAFQRRDGEWQAVQLQFVDARSRARVADPDGSRDRDAFMSNLTEGSLESLDAEFRDLRIGDLVLRVVE